MIESAALLKPSLAKQFHAAFEQTRVIFFSAPCGFGKSTAAELLLKQEGQAFRTCDAADPGFRLPSPEEDWNVLLLDRLPDLPETEQQPLCELILEISEAASSPSLPGVPPGWSFLSVFRSDDGFRRSVPRFRPADYRKTAEAIRGNRIRLRAHLNSGRNPGIPLLPSPFLRGVWRKKEAQTYPTTSDRVRHEIFLHYEEAVYRRFDLPTRRFLLSLAPFEEFSPDLAKMVSGDSRVGELLGRLQRDTTMLIRTGWIHFTSGPSSASFSGGS